MDPSLTHDPIHLELVTTTLTKEVGNLIPDLAEEIEYCVSKQLGNSTDWSEICIMESAQKMLSGITNRAFLGLPLCRNEEMLKLGIAFAQDIPLSSMMMKLFPSFVKPLVAPLITRSNRIHTREFEKILEPEIKARLEEYNSSSVGDWERQIDECESFYWLYTKENHGCYPITACASFQLKLSSQNGHGRDINALKNAWVFLRHKHPTLGSRIERDDETGTSRRIYKPFEGALEWFNDDAPIFTVPTVYIIQPKGDASHQTLFLRCPHDITDGVGILQLLNQMFTQASLGARLSPCLRVAASIPDPLAEVQVQRFHEIFTKNGEMYNRPGLMSLPPTSSPGTKVELKVKRIAVSVPKGMSAQILASCKTLGSGVSLTHVFVSALAMALAEF
ncbi:Ent-kaurene oxidase [Fusarium agapanthi]|uniref:Ent-kaurene oxidase n=1 Tax=Fusarium agapanthi TaxID=1803897 RepID=A0A9P5EEA3_9HYPO|nr:Ent-kaurene oxidase [Fusarium agapanthi]